MILTVALDNFNQHFKRLYSSSTEGLTLEVPNEIRVDKDENICLTDLWKISGGKREQAPNFWVNQDSTEQLIETVCGILNATQNCIIKTKRGKGGGTYSHKHLALAYAKYLSPELHYAVNEVFFQRLEEKQNPELAIDRGIQDWRKQGKSDEWINTRLKSKGQREKFTATLKQHGVTGNGPDNNGYRLCTNAIYDPLFGGDTKVIRQKKGIPEKASIRDNLGSVELFAIMLSEAVATENIKGKNLYGNTACAQECKAIASNVANAVKQSRKS